MTKEKGKVTLRDFAESLYHGARADNTFKFLHGQSEERVDTFLQELFRQVVGAVDRGETAELEEFVRREQARGYAFPPDRPPFWGPKRPLDPVPLASLTRPLGETTVALFSSGAIRRRDQPSFLPEGMDLPAAVRDPMKVFEHEPTLREIPFDTDTRSLIAEHVAYDLNAVAQDVNVMLPLDRLRRLVDEGVCRPADKAYSYTGLSSPQRIPQAEGPAWAQKLVDEGVGAVVMVPG